MPDTPTSSSPTDIEPEATASARNEAPIRGLSTEEVATLVERGQTNIVAEPPSRSVKQILRANALTPVNAIMLVLFALVIISGYWKDGLFVGVVFSNTVVGVAQEVKARRELAKLQVLTESKVTVLRDAQRCSIDAEEIVLGDVVAVAAGCQVPVDGEVVAGTGLRTDESMLTGESEPVRKQRADQVMSGSFVVAGSGYLKATAVGDDSYASSLTVEAKTFSAAESSLRQAVDRILRWLTIIIPIASVLLLVSLLNAQDRWQAALQGTVAAAVAMVPDGLVLLTSLAFVAGILELSRRNALAKELSTVETLARVDVLCLDKTGTITTGNIVYGQLHPLEPFGEQQATDALTALAAADDSPNNTMSAIIDEVGKESSWRVVATEPFSSSRKWSAINFEDHGWVYLGAPDVLLTPAAPSMALVEELSVAGRRLIAVARGETGPDGDRAPDDLTGVAIVELVDEIRSDANEILSYFADQDVTVKVISGDSPATVAAISERAGLETAGTPVDARRLLDSEAELPSSLETNTVFGRVAPRQKQAMVRALQAQGHVVAMTGDGVNDVLALKEADLGIAMGSGSAATRSVADLVLTDDAFSTLPVVVNEGRKVINNVERVANLFVTKAVYAVLLTFAIGVIGSPFPFLPRQLTLIGTFSIGIPGFFLALSPEVARVRLGFLRRVLWFSLPSGLVAGVATFIAYEVALGKYGLPLSEARTLATVTLLGIGLAILVSASRPLRAWKLLLVGGMAASYALVMMFSWSRSYFELDLFGRDPWLLVAIAVTAAGSIILVLPLLLKRLAFEPSTVR